MEAHGGAVFRAGGVGAGGEFGGVVEVPVFFGCDEVEVWFVEAEGEEEGFFGFGEFLEVGDGSCGVVAVAVGGVWGVGGFVGGA